MVSEQFHSNLVLDQRIIPPVNIFHHSYQLAAKYCIDIAMRNYVYDTLGNERVTFCYTEGFALCVGYNLSKTHFSIKSRRGWQRESCLRNSH